MMCHFQAQNDPFIMNNFFLVQSSISSTYWPFSLCKIFKKFLQQIQSYEDGSFLGPKWFICTQQKMFFLKKMFNIILINLLAPFIWQNLKKFFRSNPELLGCAIFRPTITQFVLNKMFWYKPLLLLSSTYWPLSLGKIKKKKILQQIQSYEDAPFLRPKWSICPKQKIFWKIIKITPIYLLAPFIVQNFKKILPDDPELWGCAIFEPKMAHFPKWEFFSENLLMSLVSFNHAHLHDKNQSQILIY